MPPLDDDVSVSTEYLYCCGLRLFWAKGRPSLRLSATAVQHIPTWYLQLVLRLRAQKDWIDRRPAASDWNGDWSAMTLGLRSFLLLLLRRADLSPFLVQR